MSQHNGHAASLKGISSWIDAFGFAFTVNLLIMAAGAAALIAGVLSLVT